MYSGNPGALDLLPDSGIVFELSCEPLANLGRCFLGECDREYPARRDAFLPNQPRKSFDQNTGFAGSRTRDHADVLSGTMRRISLTLTKPHEPFQPPPVSRLLCGRPWRTRKAHKFCHQWVEA